MKKLKILILITELDVAGAEKIVYYQAKGLKEKGHDVEVACLYGRGVMGDRIESCGIPVIYLEAKGKWDFSVLFRLRGLLKKNDYDILHCHLFHANIIGRISAIFIPKMVVISTTHVMEVDKIYRVRLEGLTSFLTDAYICVSNSVREFLNDKGKIRPDKLNVVHNGINLEEFIPDKSPEQIKRELGIEKKIIIGSVGRLHKQKGYEYLLKAAALLKKDLSDFSLLIVGDGPLKNDLVLLSKSLKIEDLVIFTGFRSDIANILNAIDIFVLPSVWEGFGLVVAEAMALSKPVVATNVDGVPEIVEDGVTGFIVEPENPEIIAKRIKDILDNPEKMDEMGKEGRIRVEDFFTVDRMVDGVENLYYKFSTSSDQ
ncbi:glycosyltransferase [Chlamydiota bacterium]